MPLRELPPRDAGSAAGRSCGRDGSHPPGLFRQLWDERMTTTVAPLATDDEDGNEVEKIGAGSITSCQTVTVPADNNNEDALNWEEFFGPTVDLVPMLLDYYDALIADRQPRPPADARAAPPRPSSAVDHHNYAKCGNSSVQRPTSSPPPPPRSDIASILAEARLRRRGAAQTRCRSPTSGNDDSHTSRLDAKNNNEAIRTASIADDVTDRDCGCHSYRRTLNRRSPPAGDTVVACASMPTASANSGEDNSYGANCRYSPLVSPCADGVASNKFPRRPLSVSSTSSALSSSSAASTSSSSLSSTSSSSCTSSLPRCRNQSYLASIESLEDDEGDPGGGVCKKLPATGGAASASTTNAATSGGGSASTVAASAGAPSSLVLSGGALCISAPCPPPGKPPRYCGGDPKLSYTDRVVLEIVETERAYVRDLNEIIEGYLARLKSDSVRVKIRQDDIRDLFGNAEDIHLFNRGFLRELELCSLDPVRVAQTFVKHNEGFAIYTQYCTNYPRTVSVLTDLMRREETAEIFKERQSALGHMLPLGSYLLKPVQRILKYHLLLQNMAKFYEKDKEGYSDVVNALATMTGIAHHINNMKRKHEHAVRVQEIQSLLYGWEGEDLTTYGELIAEGTFRVYGAKAMRHVFLFDKMLLVAKKKEDSSLSYKTHIMCSNLMLIESILGEPLCFHVIPFDNPKVQYTLQARNLEQKREWTLQLKQVILENYNVNIPSHARELVMQLGQNRPEDEVLVERSTSRKQHSAPEYLERRKQEKERRRVDNFNKALRIRRGSKKRDSSRPILPPSDLNVCRGNCRNRERSSSCDRDPEKEMERKLSLSSLTSYRSKKLRGWRRKSEPCDLLSSQESLGREAILDRSLSATTDDRGENAPRRSANTSCTCSQISEGGTSEAEASHQSDDLLSPDGTAAHEQTTDTEFEDVDNERQVVTSPDDATPEESGLDNSDEYVTFFFARRHLRRNNAVAATAAANKNNDSHSNIANGDNQIRQTSIYDVPCLRHNEGSGVEAPSVDSSPRHKNSIHGSPNREILSVEDQPDASTSSPCQRVHSFDSGCSSSDGNSTSSHHRTPTLDLTSCLRLLPEDGDGTASPTVPSVWLKQQKGHLAEGSPKAGSLPRSFQLNQDAQTGGDGNNDATGPSAEPPELPPPYACDRTAAMKMRRSVVERPHTIASDKPAPSDLDLDDFKRYIDESPTKQPSFRFPVATSGCTDDTPEEHPEIVTASVSADDVPPPFVHPEHRIYRPSLSRSSLRSLFASVGSRLAALKNKSMNNVNVECSASPSHSCSSIDVASENGSVHMPPPLSEGNAGQIERISSRLMFSVAHVYSRVVRHHHRSSSKGGAADTGERERRRSSCSPSPSRTGFFGSTKAAGPPCIHRQGSPAIGARIARSLRQSDYSVPLQRRSFEFPIAEHSQRCARQDSVLSLSSNWTSSSECEGKLSDFVPDVSVDAEAASNREETRSDASGDSSYYERSFEAIENFFDNEMFRDSAVYSDTEDSVDPDVRVGTIGVPYSLPTSPVARSSRWVDDSSPCSELGPMRATESCSSSATPSGQRRTIRGQSILEKVRNLELRSNHDRRDPSPVNGAVKATLDRCRESSKPWRERFSSSERAPTGDKDNHFDTPSRPLPPSVTGGPSTTPSDVEGSPNPSQSSVPDSSVMKGWVKHVVDKFQADT